MKKNRATYLLCFLTDDPVDQTYIGYSMLIHHVQGHPRCTPNHPVITSQIIKVYKNGRFHTKNTIWTLAPSVN